VGTGAAQEATATQGQANRPSSDTGTQDIHYGWSDAAVIPARVHGLYAGVMTVTLHLDGAVAEALAAEAARRGQTADQLAADLLAAQLPGMPRRRLTFAAVGASTSGRGAADADEMLAEGFGRD
jgi:hypothetical protein